MTHARVSHSRVGAPFQGGRAGGLKGRPYIVILVAFCLADPACSRRQPTRPNILLITLDTTRADHLGAYGNHRARTPNLDRLAAAGVLFERAITAAPLTLPAHASLLSGRYPFTHGVRNNGSFTLGDATPTLASALHDAGYRTAAFVSAFVLDHRYGLARGFDRYDDRLDLERRGADTVAAAGAWLAQTAQDRRPFFVWLHLYDPHDPYEPPSPFAEAFRDSPYDGEIAYDDQQVGELLARLHATGADRSLLVAAAGDHGESLGEHGEATHGLFVYEGAIRIPMTITGPGVPARRRVAGLVRGIDLAPTLLDAAGLPPLPHADGRSLMPLIAGSGPGPDEAYAETYFPELYMNWAPLRSIQDGRWKFIEAPSAELYDLHRDANEQTNLAATDQARTATFRRALQATGSGSPPAAPARVDRETAEKLAALGYIGAATAPRDATDTAARPDPKAMIDVFNRLREANTAIRQRQFAAAARAARTVLARDDRNAFATMILARAQMEDGEYRSAAAGYKRYAMLVPTSADAHHWRAICLSRLGEVDEAIAEEDLALALDGDDAEAHELRGGLLAARGRVEAALVDLRAAVALAPANAAFRVGLARVLIDARQLQAAGQEIGQALELQPDSADAHAAAGALAVAQGQFDAARMAFEQALARRPDADDVRLDYADALDKLGRHADARREYERLAGGRETTEPIRREAQRRLR